MTIYVTTGTLGAGKSLLAVSKMQEYLQQGRRVATNLDLNMEHLLPSKNRAARVVRLPDRPTVEQLDALGLGADVLDEKRYGLLVLDELATWMNSRTWSDKSRQALIDWLVHSRKKRWDVIFLIQHANALDKQVREMLMEYQVRCRRFDKVKLPIISALGEFITFGLWDGHLPRVHLGVVVYAQGGNAAHPLVTDRWFYLARNLYPAYDTEQVFSDSYPHGPFSYLTPWHLKGRYEPVRGLEAFALWCRGQLPEQRRPPRSGAISPRLAPMMKLPPDARWRVARNLAMMPA